MIEPHESTLVESIRGNDSHRKDPSVDGRSKMSVSSPHGEPSLDVVDEAFGGNSDLYIDVLRVQHDASAEEIQMAYFSRRSELFGMFETMDSSHNTQSPSTTERQLDAVVMAVRILGDPVLRRTYDQIRRKRCNIVAEEVGTPKTKKKPSTNSNGSPVPADINTVASVHVATPIHDGGTTVDASTASMMPVKITKSSNSHHHHHHHPKLPNGKSMVSRDPDGDYGGVVNLEDLNNGSRRTPPLDDPTASPSKHNRHHQQRMQQLQLQRHPEQQQHYQQQIRNVYHNRHHPSSNPFDIPTGGSGTDWSMEATRPSKDSRFIRHPAEHHSHQEHEEHHSIHQHSHRSLPAQHHSPQHHRSSHRHSHGRKRQYNRYHGVSETGPLENEDSGEEYLSAAEPGTSIFPPPPPPVPQESHHISASKRLEIQQQQHQLQSATKKLELQQQQQHRSSRKHKSNTKTSSRKKTEDAHRKKTEDPQRRHRRRRRDEKRTEPPPSNYDFVYRDDVEEGEEYVDVGDVIKQQDEDDYDVYAGDVYADDDLSGTYDNAYDNGGKHKNKNKSVVINHKSQDPVAAQDEPMTDGEGTYEEEEEVARGKYIRPSDTFTGYESTIQNIYSDNEETIQTFDTIDETTFDGTMEGNEETDDEGDGRKKNKKGKNAALSKGALSNVTSTGILAKIQEEVAGTMEDTLLSFEQIFNVFTLQEKEINAVVGRINKAKRLLNERK